MNRKQIICLWIGIGVFILMGLFPPWVSKYGRFSGYMFAFNPTSHSLPPYLEGRENKPVPYYTYDPSLRVDISRLSVQWIIVAVITGGLLLTFREKGLTLQGKPAK